MLHVCSRSLNNKQKTEKKTEYKMHMHNMHACYVTLGNFQRTTDTIISSTIGMM